MKFRATAITLLLLSSVVAAGRDSNTPGYGVMVWDASCILNVYKTKKTRLEAPMKDGQPDRSKIRLFDLGIDFDTTCGHIEVRKKTDE